MAIIKVMKLVTPFGECPNMDYTKRKKKSNYMKPFLLSKVQLNHDLYTLSKAKTLFHMYIPA